MNHLPKELRIHHFYLFICLFVYLFNNIHPKIHLLILERGEGGERETDVREKHQWVASSTCPDRD